MRDSVILRTPLKGKRILLGSGLLAIGVAILTIFPMGAVPWGVLFVVLLLIGAGLGFATMDHVLRIEPGEPALYTGWQCLGLPVGPQRRRDLTGVTRVVIALGRLPVSSPTGLYGPRLRPVHPVWLMSATGFRASLLGWSPEYLERVNSSALITSRPPNFAVFQDWARYCAAHAALCLNLPLEDEKRGQSYRPDEIPKEWMQRERLRFDSYHETA